MTDRRKGRWYQTVPVAGAVYENPARATSQFWDQGKWDTFIAPLLPVPTSGVGGFLEIGCNAGLFLHLADGAGYAPVLGIESHSAFVSQAAGFRATLPDPHYTVTRAAVGYGFDVTTLPLWSVVLVSNAHYYMMETALVDVLDALRTRTQALIVVSGKARTRTGMAKSGLCDVRGHCRDWTETGHIGWVSSATDTAPREGMFSVRFQGALHTVEVPRLYQDWYDQHCRSHRLDWRELTTILPALVAAVLSGTGLEAAENAYVAWQIRRNQQRPDQAVVLCRERVALVADLRDYGQRRPIYLDSRGGIIDGLIPSSCVNISTPDGSRCKLSQTFGM